MDDDRPETMGALSQACAKLTATEPGPFTTRLVDIAEAEAGSWRTVEEHAKTFRTVGDAVRAIRNRSSWTKDMGCGPFLKPEV